MPDTRQIFALAATTGAVLGSVPKAVVSTSDKHAEGVSRAKRGELRGHSAYRVRVAAELNMMRASEDCAIKSLKSRRKKW